MKAEESDLSLLSAIVDFVSRHSHPAVQRFGEAVSNWGDEWRRAAPTHLPAADYLAPALSLTTAATHGLTALFERERARLRWEQSYTKADATVGDDMLARYGFAELLGRRGPFLSERIRAGVAVWGPRVDYPTHRHGPEEAYVLLAGRAEFELDRAGYESRAAGDVVHVPPLLPHGLRTGRDPLVVFYLWQAGDLREKSSFC